MEIIQITLPGMKWGSANHMPTSFPFEVFITKTYRVLF
jgi:hypothetical protein